MTDNRDARQLGLPMALALVVGNIIGAGIFLLPNALAPLGQNAIYGWLLTIAGCLCTAWVFAQLAAVIEGGPYAYVREAGGETAAFAVMWSYWVSIWTAIPALAIAGVSALSSVMPALGQPLVAPAAAVAAIWLFTLVNMRGARSAGDVQLLTTLLKILPLIAVIIVAGALFGRGEAAAKMAPLAISARSIATAATLAVFAMVGLEAATLPVGKIKNAARVVPLATIGGTASTGLLYLAAVSAILFLLPFDQAAMSPAPFADAIAPALGPWAGTAMALFVAVSALGCLNGWVLCSGEVPLALARDGVFPAWFGKTSAIGTPIRGQVASSIIASLLVASNASRSMSGLFTFIVLVSTVATLVLYASCAAAALVLVARKRLRGGATFVISLLALLFSLWAFYGAGNEASLWGAALVLMGVPVYFLMRSRGGSTRVAAVSPAAPRE